MTSLGVLSASVRHQREQLLLDYIVEFQEKQTEHSRRSSGESYVENELPPHEQSSYRFLGRISRQRVRRAQRSNRFLKKNQCTGEKNFAIEREKLAPVLPKTIEK